MHKVGKMTTNDQFGYWFGRHWLAVVNTIMGMFVILPLLAPLLMAGGWIGPAKVIYWVYSFVCHQLPERSYFLFGPKVSYSLSEIQSVWKNTLDAGILRQFIGNPQMGWKMAWSDRMFSMFTSIWVFGILWGVFKKKIKKLSWWMAFLFILPMAIDGTTHMISDFAGLGQGFRDTNIWLASMTNHSLAPTFYGGDAWGSFNAWMRLITGVLFGFGTVWFGFALLNESVANSMKVIKENYEYRSLIQREKERILNIRLAGIQEPHDSNINKINRGGNLNE